MKENEKLRLEEDARENANSQEEAVTTEEGMKDETEVVEEKEVNEFDSELNNEEDENSSKRKVLIFSIVGVIALALVIVLCIVFANSARENKQEETANQQSNAEVKTEQQPIIVVEESTPEPTEKTTPEPTTKPVEMVSWEEWASQPGEEEPHLVVWNEEKGKQLIIEPDSEYTLEEGDRLAVSVSLPDEKLEAMGDVYVSSEITGDTTKQKIVQTEYGQYWEVILEEKGFNDVYYAFNDLPYMYYIEK